MEEEKIVFPIPAFRYLLGLSDLTGELMRFATNAVGSGEAGNVVVLVLNLIRDLRSSEYTMYSTALRNMNSLKYLICTGLDPFVALVKDMRKKQTVTTQSMRKIEDGELLRPPVVLMTGKTADTDFAFLFSHCQCLMQSKYEARNSALIQLPFKRCYVVH